MTLRLAAPLEGELRSHAEAEYPYECCGVIVGRVVGDTKFVQNLVPMLNVHDEGHERRFLIDPRHLALADKNARDQGLDILGFYHSHPDHPAKPSETDRAWGWPWYSYIIVSVAHGKSKELTCWNLTEDGEQFLAETIIYE